MSNRLLFLFILLSPLSAATLTGVHWAEPTEYAMLKSKGIDFVVTTANPADVARRTLILNTAESTGMKVILGAYPEPYRFANGKWTITPDGTAFLNYLKSRPSSVMAVFVYNEPYWVSPLTGATSSCGAMSAADLRSLRTKIKTVWPEAKIYHDLGIPSFWAPGGEGYKSYPCIGNKYADQTGVADYVGIWSYPFSTTKGYTKAESLAVITRETAFAANSMQAQPVVLGQSSSLAAENLRFPTMGEIQDWNCALRGISNSLISWYVWAQKLYVQELSMHPEYLPAVVQSACVIPSPSTKTFRFTITDSSGTTWTGTGEAVQAPR